MSRRRLALVLLAPILGCVGGQQCNGPAGPPPDDTCTADPRGVVTALELGVGDAQSYRPLHDGSVAPTVSGGQGATMLPIRIRVTGAPPPSCLAHVTEVTASYGVVTRINVPLATYPDPGGSRTTRPHFLILGYGIRPGQWATVTTTVGSQVAKATIWLDQPGEPYPEPPADLGPLDAGPNDLPPFDLPSWDGAPPDQRAPGGG